MVCKTFIDAGITIPNKAPVMETTVSAKNSLENENFLKEKSETVFLDEAAITKPPASKKKRKNRKKKKNNGPSEQFVGNNDLEEQRSGSIDSKDKEKPLDEKVKELENANKTLSDLVRRIQIQRDEAEQKAEIYNRDALNTKQEHLDIKKRLEKSDETVCKLKEENENLQDMLRNVGNELVESRDEIKELIEKQKVQKESVKSHESELSSVMSSEILPKASSDSAGSFEPPVISNISKELINKEYARNVLLQFLENHEHRDKILPILSTALDLEEVHQHLILKNLN